MSIPSQSNADDEQQQNSVQPYHHPCPPSDELFDVSTTVDPSYVISLIRKLLPPCSTSSIVTCENEDRTCDLMVREAEGECMEEGGPSKGENEVADACNDEHESMDTVGEVGGHDARDERLSDQDKHEVALVGEKAWEEYGCVLWDLAANEMHAELMVQNLVLEVLLANLSVSQSARVTEISLGIIGNLACHEILRNNISNTEGLIEIIVDKLFFDDIPCLSEACRLLTLCLQGIGGLPWAEAIQPETVISRILWIAENTLNPQLIEKSVGMLLAVLECQTEVRSLLLPGLMKLGLPRILINLLAFEMSKLMGERVPERYGVIDLVLRTGEALSVVDNYSQELCSSKELFRLLIDLIKLPDKIEVANCCVTAAILMANMLTDAAGLVMEISQDLLFFRCLLDIFPFALDDAEARNAIWSIISMLLLQFQDVEVIPSILQQHVSVLVSNSDLIKEELFDHELGASNINHESLSDHDVPNPRITALRRICCLLSQWRMLKSHGNGNNVTEKDYDDKEVDKLLECCYSSKQFISVFDGFKVLKLPYKQGANQIWEGTPSFNMYIFLPDAKDGLYSLAERALSSPGFLDSHEPCRSVEVGDFRIPKFKFEHEIEASEALKSLGLVLPFDPDDVGIREITDHPLCISKMLHKSVIEVDEIGTEAAAATVAEFIVCTSGRHPKIRKVVINFVADHPFMYVIRESSTGSVQFIGHVLNPSTF
ncbi:ARM repeat superfamily protein [Heracleum sosnowskyi]|uniref:ARM repeat superfamily protein n=1 Tax=Heracleum sosnowskyi TaxID=360622 RepID=A0AAD8HWA9_9APIA|nr:ARM repeat superfamily protein [Heracleum sosnowskyi]